MDLIESDAIMDAIRKVVNSEVLRTIIEMPTSLKNRRVEIIILPIDDAPVGVPKKKSAYGILKQYANPALTSAEASAWQNAMNTKHAAH